MPITELETKENTAVTSAPKLQLMPSARASIKDGKRVVLTPMQHAQSAPVVSAAASTAVGKQEKTPQAALSVSDSGAAVAFAASAPASTASPISAAQTPFFSATDNNQTLVYLTKEVTKLLIKLKQLSDKQQPLAKAWDDLSKEYVVLVKALLTKNLEKHRDYITLVMRITSNVNSLKELINKLQECCDEIKNYCDRFNALRANKPPKFGQLLENISNLMANVKSTLTSRIERLLSIMGEDYKNHILDNESKQALETKLDYQLAWHNTWVTAYASGEKFSEALIAKAHQALQTQIAEEEYELEFIELGPKLAPAQLRS